MIWNILKQWFWCGVFHKTVFRHEYLLLTDDPSYYKGPNIFVCEKCGTEFEESK